MGKLAEQARSALDAAREDAKQAWTEFDEVRDAMSSSEEEPSEEAVRALEEMHELYEEKHATVVDAEQRWQKLVTIEGSGIRQTLAPSTAGNGGATQLDMIPSRKQLEIRTPGQRFIQSDPYKALMAGGSVRSEQGRISTQPVEVWSRAEAKHFGDPESKAGVVLNTVTDAPGGYLVVNDRLPEIMPLQGIWPRSLLPYIPRSTTESDTVEWVTVASFTNAAAPVTQATDLTTTGAKPQSDMALGIVQTPVQTIAHWIAATRQALADAQRLSDLIDQHLRMGIEVTLENQILNGSGTAPNLRGIMNTVGINAITPTAAPVTEAIFAGIQAVIQDGYQPGLIVMNPADFATVRLSKDSTQNYYYGPPSIAGPATMWGLPILQTPRMTAGMALVGDFSYCTLWVREGTVVMASSEHADFFIRNIVAILAEGRWAFGVSAPSAFATVDLVV